MDSNESHQGSRAGLWSDWESTNESHQGSRASLWSEAFNLVLGTPPGVFPEIGKGSQDSDGFQRISPWGAVQAPSRIGKGSRAGLGRTLLIWSWPPLTP